MTQAPEQRRTDRVLSPEETVAFLREKKDTEYLVTTYAVLRRKDEEESKTKKKKG